LTSYVGWVEARSAETQQDHIFNNDGFVEFIPGLHPVASLRLSKIAPGDFVA